jgi:hypothetical protein
LREESKYERRSTHRFHELRSFPLREIWNTHVEIVGNRRLRESADSKDRVLIGWQQVRVAKATRRDQNPVPGAHVPEAIHDSTRIVSELVQAIDDHETGSLPNGARQLLNHTKLFVDVGNIAGGSAKPQDERGVIANLVCVLSGKSCLTDAAHPDDPRYAGRRSEQLP